MVPTRVRVLVAAFAGATLLLGACSGDGDTVSVSDESEERSTTSEGASSGATSAYCQAAEELNADSGLDLSEDPDAALAGLEKMAAAAPDEVAGDFETLLGGIRGLVDLEDDDPEALAGIFELMTDPEFEAATQSIEEFTGEECGIELGATAAEGEDDGSVDLGDEGQVDLEAVDEVKDANSGSAWADKLSTTVINFGRDVSVSSGEGELTVDEAIEACNALLSSLGMIEPEVTVEVSAGETLLVETVDGLCVAA
jgi:hypothetical protein